MVIPKHEQVEIVVVGNTPTWDSVPGSSGSREEGARGELTSTPMEYERGECGLLK